MDKINFENLPSTSTPLNATTLNGMQSNIEKSVNYIGTTQPATTEKVWYKKGKNLIDPSRLMIGTANTGDGKYRYVDISVVTDFIPVEAGTYICKLFNAGTIRIYRVVGYDAYKGYLWDDTNLDVIENSNTLAGTKYLRICFKKGSYESGITIQNVIDAQPQLEQNTTATTYEAHVDKEILLKNNNGVFEKFYSEKDVDNKLSQKVNNYAYPWTNKVDLDIVSGEMALIMANVGNDNLVIVASKGGSVSTTGYSVKTIYTTNTITYTITRASNHLTIDFSTQVIAKIMK